MRRSIVVLLAALAACSKPAAGPGMTVYQDPAKRFTAEVPSDWRVLRKDDGASLFGPPGGPAPFTAALSISVENVDPQSYQAAQASAGGTASPLAPAKIAGRDGFRFRADRTEALLHSSKTQPVTIQTALVPLKDGLLVIAASANPGGEAAADDALAKALSSLQIK